MKRIDEIKKLLRETKEVSFVAKNDGGAENKMRKMLRIFAKMTR